ncbi:DUF5817 domain-containing protein [Halocatena halophila]|uniref:DUF5817 domain-containing protein n=1 Tax=Halocatena halophila TaxID=2814576 RepID=UPI002ED33773
MYSVVGCPECEAITVVADRPETTGCPRCRKRLTFEKLRVIYQSDDPDKAREIRGRLLADRSGHADAFESVDSFAALETEIEESGISPKAYRQLAGGGEKSPTPVSARTESGSGNRTDRVKKAIRSQEKPTRGTIIKQATENGVPKKAAESILEKLRQNGELTVTDGAYRLL